MLSREFNINLDIIRINKYIKRIQVTKDDVYQCILNVKVFRDDKLINLDDKQAIIYILTSNQDLIKYDNHVISDNILKIRLVNINTIGKHTIHIVLTKDNKRLTLPLITFKVVE